MTFPERTDGLWTPARRPLTLGLVLTITLVASESLAISAAMPIVARDLGGLDLYGWVFSAFFLGNLVGITMVGGLIDERGLVFPFVAGLVLFATGLLLGGLAPSMPVLIAARFVQGLGGGAVQPVAYVAIGRALPERLRPRMFANLSAAWVLPGVFGPALAGFVAQAFHWRLVFLGLLPILLVAGTIATRALRKAAASGSGPVPEDGSSPKAVAEHRRRLLLALGIAAGGALLTAGLANRDPALLAGMCAIGLGLTIVSFRPLTPRGTFRLARGYPSAVLLRGLLTFTFFSVDAFVTLLLVEVRGWSALQAGIALTGATVAWSAGSWFQARRSPGVPPERFVQIGFPIVGLGLAGLALSLVPTIPAIVAVPAFALAGFGMGLAYSQFAIVVLRDAPPATHGSVTAATSLSDGFGTALGTGVTTAFIAAATRAAATPAQGIATGLTWAIAVGVGASLLGFVLAHRLRAPDGPVPAGAPAPVR